MEELLERLIENDSEFSESKFKSKVENEFIQIMMSIITGKTEKIHHFVNEETYNKILNKVKDDITKNRIQLYDELNVSNIQIKSIEELNNSFKIEVQLIFKAYDYFIDRTNKSFISGNREDRKETLKNLTFEKIKDAKKFGHVIKCTTCGANIDINSNGKCKYCGNIFKLENYDWVITGMDI